MEFEELKKIVESNARAIQAVLEAQATERLKHEEWKEENVKRLQKLEDITERLTVLNEGVVRLVSSLDDDRPTILRRLTSIENKIDQLVDREQSGFSS